MKRFFTRVHRRLFCRKGYGVHSPFVFELITNVLEEKHAYYGYADLKTARLFLQQDDEIRSLARQNPLARQALRKQALSLRECEWLFRLSNRFQLCHTVVVGSAMGLTPLSLTKYVSHGLHCIALEEEPTLASITRSLLRKRVTSPVEVRCGAYADLLPKALNELGTPDCIVLDVMPDVLLPLFRQCIDYIGEDTMLIIRNIRHSSAALETWRTICACPSATVCIDAYTWGIVFFRKGLPQQLFKTFVD